jgi:putative ATP-dependent endonuclease of OLD family
MELKQSIKILKLIVKNYRGIGPTGLEIDIDDIVVLVGPNNSGKSTILKAFKLISTASEKIKLDDFYNSDINNKPEIEVWSKVLDSNVHIDKIKWVNSNKIVKERWIWNNPEDEALRVGFRADLNIWASSSDNPRAPFSNDGASIAYRPSPTYISPFDQPEKQIEEIKKIIAIEIYESIKSESKKDKKYSKLLLSLNTLQTKIRSEAKSKENDIAKDLEVILNALFSNTKISLEVPSNNPDILATYANAKDINFKINNLSLENQGSGMQRALLWSVLKMLASRKKVSPAKNRKIDENKSIEIPERTKILLMDEPEVCLHPESIRQAKEILYNLASNGEWQIMITTHSPIFIDLAKDNTNIIRVQKEEKKVSIFKTNEANLSVDENKQLKMLNIFDPYFAEFFFAKNIIVVEGDTEYTAFNKIINLDNSKFKDIHIIRARGKYTIIPIIKILTKWGKNFSILHDSDLSTNPQSWPANKQILDIVNIEKAKGANIKLIACKKNFEFAFFKNEVSKDKPFNSFQKLDDVKIFNKVNSIFKYLCNQKTQLSKVDMKYVREYQTINELVEFVK